MDATAAMALAAREASVTRLVNLVMLQSSPDAPTPRMRQNYLSEQVFEWADIGAVHIRATVFYENLGLAGAPEPAGAGRDPAALGQRDHRAAAGRGRRRRARRGRPAHRPASLPPAAPITLIGTTISLKEIIATFARVLARNVHYQEISDEEWRRDAAARGYNPHAIEHLSSLWRALRGCGDRSQGSPLRGHATRSSRSAAPSRRRSRPSCAKARASCWRNRLDRCRAGMTRGRRVWRAAPAWGTTCRGRTSPPAISPCSRWSIAALADPCRAAASSATAPAFGDADNPALRSAIRAHAHFAEYVPIIALMVAMLEMSGAAAAARASA